MFDKLKQLVGKGDKNPRRQFEDESGVYTFASADDFESWDDVDSADVPTTLTDEEKEVGG